MNEWPLDENLLDDTYDIPNSGIVNQPEPRDRRRCRIDDEYLFRDGTNRMGDIHAGN